MVNSVSSDEQRVRDAEHLKILAVCHYVLGGVTALASTLFLGHFFVGLALVMHPAWLTGGKAELPLAAFGGIFMVVGLIAVLGGWILGALQIYSGRMLQLRKKHLFSVAVAALSCMSVRPGRFHADCAFATDG